MSVEQYTRDDLARRVLGRFLAAILLIAAMLFIPAGTIRYWEAWVYLEILFVPMLFVAIYFIKKDPELLERRMKMKEKEAEQQLIVWLSSLYFVVIFLLPGLDKRFGWSSMDLITVMAADLVIVLSYALFVLVLKENRYASRIVEVEPQQQVIMTGPYAWIRHPMYLAVFLMCVFTPLALGSYWAMLPTPLLLILLVARIRSEEHLLLRVSWSSESLLPCLPGK